MNTCQVDEHSPISSHLNLPAHHLSNSLPRTSTARPECPSHASSHARCTACLRISAEHVSNTHVRQTQSRFQLRRTAN